MSFGKYVLKRLLHAFATFIATITFTFVMIRQIPGGPAGYLQAQLTQAGASGARADLVKEYLVFNPDAPVHVQYVDYVVSVLSGDLGTSVWYQEPTLDIMLRALPWTVFYGTIAMSLIFGISVVAGAFIAYREQSQLDSVITILSVVCNSTPYYVVALLALYVLSYQYGWFPTGGHAGIGVTPEWSLAFVGDALHHAILPIASLVLTMFGMKLLLMRGNSISILGEDYLRVARLRGLSEFRIATRYVARNAILPMYTDLMLSIGFIFSGSILLETIFNYRGVGYYIYLGIEARDHPLMMASFLIVTLAVIVAIFFADLTYHLLDPRLRGDGQ